MRFDWPGARVRQLAPSAECSINPRPAGRRPRCGPCTTWPARAPRSRRRRGRASRVPAVQDRRPPTRAGSLGGLLRARPGSAPRPRARRSAHARSSAPVAIHGERARILPRIHKVAGRRSRVGEGTPSPRTRLEHPEAGGVGRLNWRWSSGGQPSACKSRPNVPESRARDPRPCGFESRPPRQECLILFRLFHPTSGVERLLIAFSAVMMAAGAGRGFE